MKYFLFLLLIIFSSASFADDNNYGLHFGISAFGAPIISQTLVNKGFGENEAKVLGITTMVSLGLLKEMTDEHFSRGDMFYDTLGAVTGTLLYWEF